MAFTLLQGVAAVNEKLAAEKPAEYGVVDAEFASECDEGWVFRVVNKKYLETRDNQYIQYGSGGYLFDKNNGEVVHFPSFMSRVTAREQFFELYHLGYLDHANWDMLITSVRDTDPTLSMLQYLHMQYVAPDEEDGVVWKIACEYDREQIRVKLCNLPVRFNLGQPYGFLNTVERFKNYEHFQFQILPNEGFVNTP